MHVLLVLFVRSLDGHPNVFERCPGDRGDPNHAYGDWSHSYPKPFSPERLVLDLIDEPSSDRQKAPAMYPSKDVCCERDVLWLAISQFQC